MDIVFQVVFRPTRTRVGLPEESADGLPGAAGRTARMVRGGHSGSGFAAPDISAGP